MVNGVWFRRKKWWMSCLILSPPTFLSPPTIVLPTVAGKPDWRTVVRERECKEKSNPSLPPLFNFKRSPPDLDLLPNVKSEASSLAWWCRSNPIISCYMSIALHCCQPFHNFFLGCSTMKHYLWKEAVADNFLTHPSLTKLLETQKAHFLFSFWSANSI